MKKLLLIIVIGFFACNDPKDPPDDYKQVTADSTKVDTTKK